MLQAVEAVRARWAGLELPLEIGIGINSGPMLIGNMGSQERFTYTVIGDEAHLGARLEEANKDFRTRILISEATFAKVRDRLAARELDLMKFRGLEQPVRVFELLGERPLEPPAAQRLERFEAALASYRSGDLAAAASSLRGAARRGLRRLSARDLARTLPHRARRRRHRRAACRRAHRRSAACASRAWALP